MSSLESVSETRTDLIAYITDQLNNGVYKTAVGVAQALAESKVSWVPSVMFGGGSSSNSAMDAVGLKMLLDITKSLDKTSK